jgi:low affinity Fe/Cu permease
MIPPKSKSRFTRFAKWTSRVTGRPVTFLIAVVVILVWIITGPLFGFSDTWQLIINTGTTIVTFLMVFLIQNTQNRDSEAIHIKLDELIRAVKGAHNALLDLEELEDEHLDRIRDHYERIAEHARADLQAGLLDTDVIEVSDEDEDDQETSGKQDGRPRSRHR